MEKYTITRQELYDLVWKESLTAISKRLNIPFTHLRKICCEMNVPIPPNGHWSKIQFGKSVEIIKLPQDYQGENEIKLYPDENGIADPEALTFHYKSEIDKIKEDKNLLLTVPKKLTNPDKLVEDAHRRLIEYRYNQYNDHGMVRSEEGGLKIRVARENIGRALRFMDTFIKLMRIRGHNVIIKYGCTYAVIDGEEFKIGLMEKCKKVAPEHKGDYATYLHTGIFYFSIDDYYGRNWTDGKALIEEKLAEILAKLEALAKQEKEDRRIQEEHQQKRREKELIILEQQQRIEKERSDFQDLYKQAKRWQRARFMRDYIKAVELNAVKKDGLTEELKSWLDWANNKVDWYDPLINKKDELLKNKDKKAL